MDGKKTQFYLQLFANLLDIGIQYHKAYHDMAESHVTTSPVLDPDRVVSQVAGGNADLFNPLKVPSR